MSPSSSSQSALSDQDVLDAYTAIIPEPASVVLVGLGGVMLLSRRRRA